MTVRLTVLLPVLLAGIGVASAVGSPPAEVSLESHHPYRSVQGIAGNIKSIGSDTMNNLMTHWAESFNRFYPNVKIEIEGKGSSTAPVALIEGQAQFGPMSRAMKFSEIDAFERRFGYKPTLLRTGIDTLVVFVHKDCPLDEITLDQIERIFSVGGPDMTWDQLGVRDPAYRGRPISLYGRNSASGTYGFFKEVALGGRDYKTSVKEQPGSSAVVQAVARDRFAMGYSGLGYATADVKALRVSYGRGEPAYPATAEYALSGDYPIARFLYIYINQNPRHLHSADGGLDPLRAAFIRMMYSREGQEVVLKDGYFALPPELARQELERLGLMRR